MSTNNTPEPISVTVKNAAAMIGVSRATIYNLANRRELSLRKVAGRTVVLVEDLKRLVSSEAA